MFTYKKAVTSIIVVTIGFFMSGCHADNQSSFDELTNQPEERIITKSDNEISNIQTDGGGIRRLRHVEVWSEGEINSWENITQQRLPSNVDTMQ